MESLTRRRAVLVLGMHRSGTSAMTRSLAELGAALPKTLMPPSSDNPEGFWESSVLMAVHDSILERMDRRWDTITEMPDGWAAGAEAEGWANEIAASVQSEFGDAPLFVVKDPRVCLLLPLWLNALARLHVEPAAVLTVRHPLEVAASIAKRNAIAPSDGWLLWLRHVLCAERDSRGIPRTLVTYERLVADPDSVARDLAAWLEVPDVPSLRAIVRPDLRHHAQRDETSRELPGIFAACWQLLSGDAALEPRTWPAYDALATALRQADDYERERQSLLGSLAGLQDEIAHLETALRAKDAQHADALRAFELTTARHAREAEDAARRIDDLSRRAAELEVERDSARGRGEGLSGRLAASEEALAQARHALASAELESGAAGQLAQSYRAELDAIYRSRTWRLIAPLRRSMRPR